MDVSLIVVVVVMTALVFDFTNGFHDTANAMATSIATGALRPKVAVAIAGCLNLVGAFLSVQVAKTISGGLVDESGYLSELDEIAASGITPAERLLELYNGPWAGDASKVFEAFAY